MRDAVGQDPLGLGIWEFGSSGCASHVKGRAGVKPVGFLRSWRMDRSGVVESVAGWGTAPLTPFVARGEGDF